MPEEDDDALGEMLGQRLKENATNAGTNDGSSAAESTQSAGDARNAGSSEESTERTEPTESAESTQRTQPTPDEDEPSAEAEPSSAKGSTADTARSRSPFPLYITPGLKEDVQDRFEKFNAERTLDEEPRVEKHKHFMEGLLRAGLDHPDLEEYVIEEYEER